MPKVEARERCDKCKRRLSKEDIKVGATICEKCEKVVYAGVER